MLLKRLFIILICMLPWAVAAQVEESIEQWVEETEDAEAAADMNDLLLQLQAQPININDTAAMASLPLITPFQYKALRNYILLHGQLLTLKELLFIPSFDSATLLLLKPFITVAPHQEPNHWRLRDGRHSLVTGIGGTIEKAEGYQNGHYDGDNLHALLCYQYKLNRHISLRFTADKDPSEAWGKNNFYGYHLMIKDLGRIEQLILGRYYLQFGQGLTLWTGLRPFNLMGTPPFRYGAGIRPASAFYEEGFMEGLAARINLGHHFHLTSFGSYHDGEALMGGHLDYRRGNLILGLTADYSSLDDSLTTRDYTYNQNRFQGQRQLNTGFDATYQWNKISFFGEVAINDSLAIATIFGLQLKADSKNRLGISYRYHHPQYNNLHAQGYAIGNTQGEQGITLDAENQLPLGMTLLSSLDLHHFPILRYADYSPSTGAWLRIQLARPWGNHLSTSLRYSYRMKERNIPNLDSTLYLGEQTFRQQLQGEVKGNWNRWTLTVRSIYVLFNSENGVRQQGLLFNLTARYDYRRLQTTLAMAYYDIDGYYARIYLSESNLQYVWSMPALYGRGLRGHLLLRYKLNNHFSFAAKYALTYLPEQEYIGNGDARTTGPLRQTWFAQLRFSF